VKTKITVDLECTPGEARQLAGLPDLQPMYDQLIVEIEQRFRDAIDKLSLEAVLQQWFGVLPGALEQVRLAVEKLMKERTGE